MIKKIDFYFMHLCMKNYFSFYNLVLFHKFPNKDGTIQKNPSLDKGNWYITSTIKGIFNPIDSSDINTLTINAPYTAPI